MASPTIRMLQQLKRLGSSGWSTSSTVATWAREQPWLLVADHPSYADITLNKKYPEADVILALLVEGEE